MNNSFHRRTFRAALSLIGSSFAGPRMVARPSECEAQVEGTCEPQFKTVRAAFERNFRELGELGAGVCGYLDGREVFNLWGGFANHARTQIWRRDTLVGAQSSQKGLYPFCVHALVNDGLAHYDDLVIRYWPAYGQNGKEKTTIRHLVSHWAGLEHTFPIDVYSRPLEEVMPVIEASTPSSMPGTVGAYHSQTYMPLVAALVKKISGRNINHYFRERIAGPLGIDAYLNVPPSEYSRCADEIIPVGSSYYSMFATTDGKDKVWAPAPYPFFYGGANARAYARLFGAIARGGVLDDVRALNETTIDFMRQRQWESESIASASSNGLPLRGCMGWFMAGGAFDMGPNPVAFGMPGAGGNLALADPTSRLGFGYTLNSAHTFGNDMGPRLRSLLDAVYASLKS